MFGFKKKAKPKPPPLPDQTTVALRDLELKVTESQAAALAAKWQVMAMRDEIRDLRNGLATALVSLKAEIEKKRVIKVPLKLTVGK